MKITSLLLLMIIAVASHGQTLHARVTNFYAVAPNTDFLEESYKQIIYSFVSPITKLNKDSIASDCYSYWNAQNAINNKMIKFTIDSLSLNIVGDSAIVYTNQLWFIDGSDKFVYSIISEWTKYDGAWYFSDKPSKNIMIKRYYEENKK